MAVDYESAYVQLQALIAEKPQHGRQELLSAAARIVAENQTPEGDVERFLRVHGTELIRSVLPHTPVDAESLGGGFVSSSDAGSPATIDRGDHDGSEHHHLHSRPVGA